MKVTAEIERFCRQLNPRGAPVWVDVEPTSSAERQECFFNVREKIDREGGEAALGWTIWEWPSTMLDAEFHSVWRDPQGRLIDVTPKDQGETRILFLEDPDEAYDYSQPGKWRDNVRYPLCDEPDVHRLIRLASDFFALQERNSEGRLIRLPTLEFEPLAFDFAETVQRLKTRRVGRNASCPCGSRRKHKLCCGR